MAGNGSAQTFPGAQSPVVDNPSGLMSRAWLLFFVFLFGRVGGQGIVMPGISTVNKLSIVNPSPGLMVFDSTLNKMSFFNGTSWETVTSA